MDVSVRRSLAQNWWVFTLRGLFGLVFGVLAFVRPGATLLALVTLFGAYALVDGIVLVAAGLMVPTGRQRVWLVLDGVLGIAVGVLTFGYPGATAIGLLYLLGTWFVVAGIAAIAVAVELRKQIENEWFYILGGVLSIAIGAVTLVQPAAIALAWAWVLGVYVVIYGITMLGVGSRLHRLATGPLRNSVASQ